jgi:DinB superfamily
MSQVAESTGPSDLAILVYQVRECTLRLFDDTDGDALTWTLPGTSNHILWHAGHAVWVADALTIEPITGRSELPEGWAAKFGQHSQPATVDVWPEGAEVRSRLEVQLKRVLDLLREHRAMIVAKADHAPREGDWPLLHGMIHGWHDEARHQGEMYLLQKLRRAQR